MKFETIPQMFYEMSDKHTKESTLFEKKDGKWKGLKYSQVKKKVEDFGGGLVSLGVEKGDKVAIFSSNNRKWAVSDYAIAAIGAVSVTIYPSLIENQIEYILKHSDAKFVISENRELTERINNIKDNLPNLKGIISMSGQKRSSGDIYTFEDVEKRGEKYTKEKNLDIKNIALSVKAEDLHTLVYTSGTTGEPKGVMLLNKNIVANIIQGKAAIPVDTSDKFLSFLPLSHCFERTVGHYVPFASGSSIYYVEDMEKIADNLAEVKPTVMSTVPRLFEKMRIAILAKMKEESAIKRGIFNWSLGVGTKSCAYLFKGEKPKGMLGMKHKMANKLVFSKLRQKVGGNLRFFVSGGAALSEDVGNFFGSMSIPILEGYGLTETSPVITCNREDSIKIGTVGKPLNGVEVRIAKDGEVLCRGDNVMAGYYKNPEATKEVIDDEGWFYTGDIGLIDKDGCLKITDRKKNIIVTAYGKNVVPVPLETAITDSPLVDQCIVLGNEKPFVAGIIVPCFEALKEICKEKGIKTKDKKKLAADKKVKAIYKDVVECAMQGFAKYEKVKDFILTPEEWTIENGMLTPTLKTRRRKIMARYKENIAKLYSK